MVYVLDALHLPARKGGQVWPLRQPRHQGAQLLALQEVDRLGEVFRLLQLALVVDLAAHALASVQRVQRKIEEEHVPPGGHPAQVQARVGHGEVAGRRRRALQRRDDRRLILRREVDQVRIAALALPGRGVEPPLRQAQAGKLQQPLVPPRRLLRRKVGVFPLLQDHRRYGIAPAHLSRIRRGRRRRFRRGLRGRGGRQLRGRCRRGRALQNGRRDLRRGRTAGQEQQGQQEQGGAQGVFHAETLLV